jgi:hypothetical protein
MPFKNKRLSWALQALQSRAVALQRLMQYEKQMLCWIKPPGIRRANCISEERQSVMHQREKSSSLHYQICQWCLGGVMQLNSIQPALHIGKEEGHHLPRKRQQTRVTSLEFPRFFLVLLLTANLDEEQDHSREMMATVMRIRSPDLELELVLELELQARQRAQHRAVVLAIHRLELADR